MELHQTCTLLPTCSLPACARVSLYPLLLAVCVQFTNQMCLKLGDFGLAIDLREERAVTRVGETHHPRVPHGKDTEDIVSTIVP